MAIWAARSKIDPHFFLHESKADVILGSSAKPVFDFRPSSSRYEPPNSGYRSRFQEIFFQIPKNLKKNYSQKMGNFRFLKGCCRSF